MNERPIRIANFSGYLGDRFTAVDEVMAGDPVDVLIGDYLAEITLAALSARHRQDASKGYVDYFLDQLRPHLAALKQRGIKVVANAGGFHPAGWPTSCAGWPPRTAWRCGWRTSRATTCWPGWTSSPPPGTAGAPGHRGAAGRLGHPADRGERLPGRLGVAAALAEGADIVVCGRVTDASLTLGPGRLVARLAPG